MTTFTIANGVIFCVTEYLPSDSIHIPHYIIGVDHEHLLHGIRTVKELAKPVHLSQICCGIFDNSKSVCILLYQCYRETIGLPRGMFVSW